MMLGGGVSSSSGFGSTTLPRAASDSVTPLPLAPQGSKKVNKKRPDQNPALTWAHPELHLLCSLPPLYPLPSLPEERGREGGMRTVKEEDEEDEGLVTKLGVGVCYRFRNRTQQGV